MYVRNYMNTKSILARGGANSLFDDWKKESQIQYKMQVWHLFANIRTLLHDDLALFIHVIIQQNLTMKWN